MINYKELLWQEEYSVEIYEIDKQHKEILALVRDLSKLCAIDDKETYETFKIMLLNAFEYIKNHFLTEEKYMEENNYPALNEHKEMHEKMVLEIKAKIGNLYRFYFA
jgi:hemerythrin